MPQLGPNRYGKAGIRLAKVERDGATHTIRSLDLEVMLEGGFDAAYVQGDNRAVLPTDTMRGTCYAFAREAPLREPEEFVLRLARHFVATVPAVAAATVQARSTPWERVAAGGRAHPYAFTAGAYTETARARVDAADAQVDGGIDGLRVVKTAGSAFRDFLRDRYTTLPDTDERVLATAVRATWRFAQPETDAAAARAAVVPALLAAFAEHDSASVQDTLWAMGRAALDACATIKAISLVLPNQHHVLADLTPYGLDNPGSVFVVTDDPHGVIEGTVGR